MSWNNTPHYVTFSKVACVAGVESLWMIVCFLLTFHLLFANQSDLQYLYVIYLSITEYINDSEIQVDRIYQSFNQITF